MNYQSRLMGGGGGSNGMGGTSITAGNQTVGANLNFGTQIGGSATGPALVLVGIVVLLVLDYIWTRGEQGGR